MKSASHLRALQALELTLRLGSQKAAGVALGITPAAVGQRIKSLEDYLGLELILRGRAGVKPAQALAGAAQHLAEAFAALDSVAETLDFQRVQEIHIIADPDWTELWLHPRLPTFRTKYPNILLCINGIGDVPMRPGQADCTVARQDPETDSDVIFRDYMLPIASHENHARIATRSRDARFQGFPLVHLNCYADEAGWPEFISARGYVRQEPADRGVRFQRATQAIGAIRSNVGAVMMGAALAEGMLCDGLCVTLAPTSEGIAFRKPYVASYRADAARRPQLSLFRAWLAEQGAATTATLSALAQGQNDSK